MLHRIRRSKGIAIAILISLGYTVSAQAYNQVTHQEVVSLSYEIIRVVELGGSLGGLSITSVPNGVNPTLWAAFLADVAAAGPKLRTLMPVASGLNASWTPHPIFAATNPASDTTGMSIGKWAAIVDDEFDDTHLWIKPTNALGLGPIKNAINDALNAGLAALFGPLVWMWECIVNGNCGWPENVGHDLNPLDDLEGLIPGFGDITGGDYVGMWHHINMAPWASNEFDDRQGMLLEDGGWLGVLDEIELATWVAANTIGLTVNYDKSQGPKRYSITSADDFHPLTDGRSKGEWQFNNIVFTPFEPLDNLAFYGWDRFRTSLNAKDLGWPLHALGDAAAPHHVIGSFGWGHRPFEDAVSELWPEILYQVNQSSPSAAVRNQRSQARRVLLEAFTWWKFIRDWRALHPGHALDIPVRDMVSKLAQNTFNYSASKMIGGWPFMGTMSMVYFFEKQPAIEFYSHWPNAVQLHRDLLEDSAGAKLAFLTAVAEVL